MTSNEQHANHTAHEETASRTPGSHGGVPEATNVRKTAAPEPENVWVNTGGTCGGLLESVGQAGKKEER